MGSTTVLVTAATGIHVLAAIFVPFLLCLLWILLVSVRLGFRIGQGAALTKSQDAARAGV